MARFTAADLAARLSTRWLGRAAMVLEACPSTNDLAAQQARAGAAEGLVVVADAQSGGRGRLGRTWHSPSGENLYFSMLLRPTRPAAEIPPLTLLAGAALARALSGFGVTPRLKWPNDVQLPVGGQPRKVAGVLTEMTTEGGHVAHVIVGVGVNVNTRAFPPELAQTATSLRLAQAATAGADANIAVIDRLDVLTAILAAFEAAYDQFRADGPHAAVALWNPHAALGTRCRVRAGGRDVEGTSLGIDADGALLVRDDDGRVHRVVSGEPSA
ncbi:MAG TPA: biotin--[acetyl-CoA-carboxylase] ligase [Polyangia bacterium]|nr:biotin--[acetyl-CoA-carboxylase] ligase [Polyangia bacterium]